MAREALEHGVQRIVVMTLPPCRVPFSNLNSGIEKNRVVANELLRNAVKLLSESLTSTTTTSTSAATTTSTTTTPRVVLVDLATSFTDDDMVDGVHFRTEVYQQVAELIYKSLN